jgi:uncharacterized protein (TIGR03435 family)
MAAMAGAAAFAADSKKFEVASVKVVPPERGESIQTGADSVTMRHARLVRCIGWAYEMRDDQVVGPSWLNDVWVDITAKAPGEAKNAELRAMMQNLLEERFKLASHRQIKELPSLVLTVGKSGHKMEAVDAEGSPSFKTGNLNLTGKGATLAQLTEFLSKELRFPVIDQTGLTGRFNYFLDIGSYVTEEMRKESQQVNGPPADGPSIVAQAIQAQLGLKLDSKKMPVDTLVVDRIEKTPSDN